MLVTLCKSKIHRATVTDTNINYEGSITIASELMDEAEIVEWEQVHVVNVNNGQRFVTYVIRGQKPGQITVNGAAARLAVAGDKVIIIAYAQMKQRKSEIFRPSIVLVDEQNTVVSSHEA